MIAADRAQAAPRRQGGEDGRGPRGARPALGGPERRRRRRALAAAAAAPLAAAGAPGRLRRRRPSSRRRRRRRARRARRAAPRAPRPAARDHLELRQDTGWGCRRLRAGVCSRRCSSSPSTPTSTATAALLAAQAPVRRLAARGRGRDRLALGPRAGRRGRSAGSACAASRPSALGWMLLALFAYYIVRRAVRDPRARARAGRHRRRARGRRRQPPGRGLRGRPDRRRWRRSARSSSSAASSSPGLRIALVALAGGADRRRCSSGWSTRRPGSPRSIPLAALGVVLCWLYERTGSLWPCVIAHTINNGLALASAIVPRVSGRFVGRRSALQVRVHSGTIPRS